MSPAIGIGIGLGFGHRPRPWSPLALPGLLELLVVDDVLSAADRARYFAYTLARYGK